MDVAVRVVAVGVQQAAERVLHRARRRRVDVALRRRQVDDVLPVEVVGDLDAAREDLVQHQHFPLRLVALPFHVFFAEVEPDRDLVALEDGHVLVQVLTLERVGDDGLVLHADQVLEPRLAQPDDGASELPRRRVGRREREVPGDVVLQDRRGRRIQVLLDVGQVHQAFVVFDSALRLRPRGSLPWLWSTFEAPSGEFVVRSCSSQFCVPRTD